MKALNHILIALLLIAAGCAIGYNAGTRTDEAAEVELKPDTVFVTETVVVDKPVPVKVTVIDSIQVPVPVKDTVRLQDTLYVPLPMEKREYRRDEFYAVVAGYEPRLIHMEVYPKTVYVTERVTSKEKLNSLSAGIEAEYLNTFSLPVKVTYTRKVNSWFAVSGYGEYDLLSKQLGGGMGGNFKLDW